MVKMREVSQKTSFRDPVPDDPQRPSRRSPEKIRNFVPLRANAASSGVLRSVAQPARSQDARFVEQTDGDREQGLGEHVRRRKQHPDDEGGDDHVGTCPPQLIHAHPAQHDQDHDRHWHLERQPEGQKKREHEIEVTADVGGHRHALGRHRCEKREDQREDDEVGEGAAEIEQQHARNQNRQREAALVPVEPRRNEGPELVEHIRQRQRESHEEAELERREQRRGDLDGNHLGSFGQNREERLSEPAVQGAREGQQSEEHEEHREHGAQQPTAELHQMRGNPVPASVASLILALLRRFR